MVERLCAGIASIGIAAMLVAAAPRDTTAGESSTPGAGPVSACPAGDGTGGLWSRLVAHVPEPVSCQPAQQASGLVAAITGTIIERSSRTADLSSFALALAPVSGQNFTLLASGSLSAVPARCRLTVSPNPGALVLPNPRNGAVVLVCRNQPRP